jgi:hypothetical protein
MSNTKWNSLPKEKKEKIKKYYLKFYKKFDCGRCPFMLAANDIGNVEAIKLFISNESINSSEEVCERCRSFKELDLEGRWDCCPCLAYGAYDAKKNLAKLLKRWKLIE